MNYIKKIPYEVRYTLFLFLVTRSILAIIGICSRKLLGDVHNFSLGIWGVWDSGWYVEIAREWYAGEGGFGRFGFFPLYPFLIRILGWVVGNNYISAVIISNTCIILTCVFLYKLVRSSLGEDAALRSIRYLFLFPASFILSGVFSESLLLTLVIMCFYYAKKEKWLFVGILGFLVSLTRSNGVFILLPMLYEYLKAKRFNLKKIRRDISFLSLIPFGLFVFAGYCYYLTGDFSAYVHAKETTFRLTLNNPINTLCISLGSANLPLVFNAIYCVVLIVVFLLFFRKIEFSFWLYGMLFIVVPLMYGAGKIGDVLTVRPVVGSMTGMVRFSAVIFPFHILSARLSENRYVDQALTVSFALLQGFFMVFWTTGFELIV